MKNEPLNQKGDQPNLVKGELPVGPFDLLIHFFK